MDERRLEKKLALILLPPLIVNNGAFILNFKGKSLNIYYILYQSGNMFLGTVCVVRLRACDPIMVKMGVLNSDISYTHKYRYVKKVEG